MKGARKVVRDFAGVLSQTKTPGIVKGGVGEWSEGSNGNLRVGEVRVDGLRLVSEIGSACEGSCWRLFVRYAGWKSFSMHVK